MVLGVEGEQRFRIVEIVEQLPYIIAEVIPLEDDGASWLMRAWLPTFGKPRRSTYRS